MKKKYVYFVLFPIFFSFAVFFQGYFIRACHLIEYPFIYLSREISDRVNYFFAKKMTLKDSLRKTKELEIELELAKEKIINLSANLSSFKKLEEFATFKERFNLTQATPCRILLINSSPQASYALINRGTRHGVTKDMVAIYRLQIVGKVTETYDWHSKIVFITDKRSFLAAKTNEKEEEGICQGDGTDSLIFKSKNSLCSFQDGELIFSSGTGLVFPEGFCIGRASCPIQNECYVSCKVTPVFPLHQISWCLLVSYKDVPFF